MVINRSGHYFHVTFNYDVTIKNAIKALSGSFWSPEHKCWYVPVVQEEKLMKVYDKHYERSLAMSPPVVGEVPPMPELDIQLPFKKEPYPYQKQGIAYCLQKERVLICDKPGLGKTAQAIGATMGFHHLNSDAYPALVICPATLKYNWQAEWMKFAGKRSLILSDKNINTWPLFFQEKIADVFIVNYESLRKFFVAQMPTKKKYKSTDIQLRETAGLFNTVIIDEIHRCKEKATLQTKLTLRLTHGRRYIMGLTGTPIVNKTEDLIPQLHIIRQMRNLTGSKDAAKGEQYFVHRYCSSDKYRKELNFLLQTTCFFQRKKEDVLKDLPDKTWQISLCDITTRKEYEDAERDLRNYLEKYKNKSDEEIERSLRGEIMVRIGVCRHISARGKLPAAYEEIDQVISAGEKIVVFVHHREIGEAINNHYPGMCMAINGSISLEQRDINVKAFQENPNCKIAVCNIKAGGVGITLTASSNVLFIEQPWHAADEEQCIDRTHRIGQKNSVRGIKLLGANTVDVWMNDLIDEKRHLSEEITGNEDVTQREIIDRLTNSLFNKKPQEAEV